MHAVLRFLLIATVSYGSTGLQAQERFARQSVLSSGSWYQLGVVDAGIYRLPAASLPGMGFALPMASHEIRLYGAAPGLLPEAAGEPAQDDLTELAIAVVDGGDGQLDAGDHILFYSAGPHVWQVDSVNQSFLHRVNGYTDTVYYYLTRSAGGKRIATAPAVTNHTQQLNTYRYRQWHETDRFNHLSSGQEWYGERMAMDGSPVVTIPLNLPPLLPGSSLALRSTAAARSIGSAATVAVQINDLAAGTHSFSALSNSSFDVFARENTVQATVAAGNFTGVRYQLASASGSAAAWINRFELEADALLEWNGKAVDFRSWNGIGDDVITQYQVSKAIPALQVWRLSDALEPVRMPTALAASSLVFTDGHERLHEYIVFDTSANLPAPVPIGPVSNQNLHGGTGAEYLVVAGKGLEGAAEQLANWHQQRDGFTTQVVPVHQIFHEFSGGIPDPAAIRNWLKMLYDRGGATQPKYLVLLGDASFDPRNRLGAGGGLLPSFQSHFSLDPLSTFVTDDFFGLLEDGQNINGALDPNQLNINIGRIPVQNAEEASLYINKLRGYHAPANLGTWRNELTFIADDEDNNLHVLDMESVINQSMLTNPQFIPKKIYLDAFPQESDAAGSRYPLANAAIQQQMQRGTLIWNYTGHGGFRRLADEVVLDRDVVDAWQQNGRLPLFVTATCDFAPFDNPLVSSLGEYLLLKPDAGAIALMTTTRLVFAYSNRILNANYMKAALERLPDGSYRSLGEAARTAKNATFASSGDVFNNYKFTLLGDPALTLAFPTLQIHTTRVNGNESGTAELNALEEVQVSGEIIDGSGHRVQDFNGWVFPVVYDQPTEQRTRGNDPSSSPIIFLEQEKRVFSGKATVNNGSFQFSFFIPRDIDYSAGQLKISYYATDSLRDAQGAFTNLQVTGSAEPPSDQYGPILRAWLNDTLFRNGDLTQQEPQLLVYLQDPSGINILGAGFGHDITAVIDGNEQEPIVLNSFFEAGEDTYQWGWVRFQLPVLPPGEHRIDIKAWDQLNNSSSATLRFRLQEPGEFRIVELMAWPNPTRGAVKIGFVHNHRPEPIQANWKLFSASGQLIKTINGTIIARGNRSYLEWDGKSDNGVPVLPGLYIYRLELRLPDGRVAVKAQQIIVQ